MRRTDRLFQIIEIIRARRGSTTAEYLANRLEVSQRTVYRYVADLQNSGVAILGEPGTGYRLADGYSLPPLSFTQDELEALVFGIRVVERSADPALAEAANQALAKIHAVIPATKRDRASNTPLHAPAKLLDPASMARLGPIRQAIHRHFLLILQYGDVAGSVTERRVRPLGLTFWGNTWTLAAWCELRDDFRLFRLDRIQSMDTLPERFAQQPGQGWEDFLRRINQPNDNQPNDNQPNDREPSTL